jgi:hypothetical protein
MFLFDEQGWHPFIPLSRIDIEANPELLARHRNNFSIEHNGDDIGDDDDDGENGDIPPWCHGRDGSNQVSQAQFFNYHFQCGNAFSPLQYGGRLLQEIIIDA